MKTIKSVLIGALVALLGSSAWAASANPSTVDEVYVEGTATVAITGDSGSSRMVAFAKNASSGQTTWENDYISVKLASSTIPQRGSGTVVMTITGKKATTGRQTITLYRTGKDTAWLTVTVTKVTEPPFVDHGEVSIAIPPNGSQVMTATSAAAADWTIWSDNEDVATVSPASSSAKDATFTITAKGAEGETTTCVASNKYSKWTYKVTIDSHTEIDRKEISFASGATNKWTTFKCDEKTTWYAWTDRPDLVKVKIESADPKVGFAAVRPGDAEKVSNAKSVKLTITHELTNPSGTAMVYVQADGDNICHEVKAVCDVVNCVYVPLKHSDDGEDPDSWYEIPEDWVKPAEGATDDERTWGFDYAASSDKEIAEIKVKDGKFYLHAPADGRDGETRVVFVKSEAGVIDDGDKIWMFYASVSTVEVEKFLTFPEGFDKDKEALLNIRAHYLNNVKEEPTPKVLFIVTGCNSHDLNRDKVRATVSNVCQRADVDFYLFKPGQSVDDVTMRTVAKGTKTLTDADLGMASDFRGNQHSCLNGFYSLFYKLAKDPAKRYYYDYIVMEFDSQRLAAQDHAFADEYEANPEGSPNREVVVAEWLNEYYEGIKDSDGARIVWVVDDMMNKSGMRQPGRNGEWPTSAGTTPDGHPYKAYDMLWGSEDADEFFRPFQEHITGGGVRERSFTDDNSYPDDGGANLALPDNRYAALLGLLNPWKYLAARFDKATAADLAARLDSVTEKHTYRIGGADSSYDREVRVGDTYKWQAYYDDQKGLINFLNEHLVFTTYAARITDNIETQGLEFVEGTWKTFGSYNEAANTSRYSDDKVDGVDIWTPLGATSTVAMPATGEVWRADHSITGVVGNLTREFWNLVQVKIEDADGSFRLGATRIPGANKSSRDPNLNTNIVDGIYVDTTNGQAAVAYFYDVSNPDDGVDAEATTTWDWEFDFLPIKLNSWGVNREYDGTSTNATYTVDPSEDEGTEIQVAYSTDKTTWTDFEGYNKNKFTDCTNVWARFVATKDGYLSVTSESQVVITPLPVTVALVGSTNIYTAAGQTVKTVTVNPTADVGDSSRKTELSFSSDNATWSGWVACDNYVSALPTFTNCGTYTVYAKVRNLPNYTNDTVVSADVVITQRVITVTAKPATKTYGTSDDSVTFEWGWSGDFVAKEKSWIDSQIFANPESIKRISAGAGNQERAGLYANALSSNVIFSAGQNYIVNFVPGDFTIEPGQLELKANGYSGTYDGEGHTIDLQINVTNDATSQICIRTSTDNANWSEWTPWPAGDVKDILPAATNVADSMTVYIQATNRWPVTLVAAPAPTYTRNSIGNYKPASTSAKVTITPVSATLTAGDLSKDYGAADPDPNTATVMTNGVIAADAGKDLFIYTMSMSSHKENPGMKTGVVKISGEKNQGNYTLTFYNGNLMIGPKPPSPCGPCEPCPEELKQTLVYKFKASVKTTKGVTTAWTTGNGSQCAPGTETSCLVYRAKDTTKFQGWIYDCEATCETIATGNLIAWDTKRKVPITDVAFASTFINIIGKGKSDAEWAWTFGGTLVYDELRTQTFALTGAGYGRYSSSKGYYTSFSGRFAGTVTASYDLKTKYSEKNAACICNPSQILKCDNLQVYVEDAVDTVAFGTWSAIYDASASKRYNKDGYLKIPSYAK